MNEATLLVLLGNKSYYTRFKPHLQQHTMSPEGWDIVETLGKWYDSYPSAVDVNWEHITSFHFMVKGKTKPEKAILVRNLFTKVEQKKVELAAKAEDEKQLEKDLLKYYVQRDYATRIANKAIDLASNGTGDISELKILYEDYEKEVGNVTSNIDPFVPCGFNSVIHSPSGSYISWRLEELNQSLGPLRVGNLVIVAARVECGKTTLLASEATHFATQAMVTEEHPLIWVNNEQADKDVMDRLMQAYFGATRESIEKDVSTYDERYVKEVGRRLLLVSADSGHGHVRQLDSLFDRYKPSVIIFDQLDKVQGFGREEREDLRLGKLYAWAREKARKYGPVITASQLDASADSQQYIGMIHLRGSKTDKAGEADAIITIGKNSEVGFDKHRYIHIPKNKLPGGPSSKETNRHGYFEVEIKAEIARYDSFKK